MAEPARKIDRLDVTPRFSAGDAIRLNTRFRNATTHEVLEAVLHGHLLGEIALVSSFGAE